MLRPPITLLSRFRWWPWKKKYSISYFGGGEMHKLLHPDHFWPDGTLKSPVDRPVTKPWSDRRWY